MTPLLCLFLLAWMFQWLPLVLTAMRELPVPVNLTLIPGELSCVLRWDPGPGTPAEAHYRVSISTVRGRWEDAVAGCQHVKLPLVCDLTEAFTNPLQTYIINVRAVVEGQASAAAFTPTYKPMDDLTPPLLTVSGCGKYMCVDLRPPRENLRSSYNLLSYQLKVQIPATQTQFERPTRSLDQVVLEDLAPGRQFCVSVRFSDRLEGKKSNYTKPVCVFTTGVFSADVAISVVLCLLVLALVFAVILLLLSGSICLRTSSLPSVLTSVPHSDELLVLPCRPSLSLLFNIKPYFPSELEKTFCEHSDEESATESSQWSHGQDYKQRVSNTDLLSSVSSSSAESASSVLNHQPLTSPAGPGRIHSTAPISAHTSFSLATQRQTEGGTEEEEVAFQGDSHHVDLLTLTFGKVEEQKGTSCLSLAEDVPSSEAAGVSTHIASGCADKEEEVDSETDTGYMSRAPTKPAAWTPMGHPVLTARYPQPLLDSSTGRCISMWDSI